MSPINIVLWVGGVVLIAIGYNRARGPLARYNAWRGGVRNDDSTTGASVAMAVLRRQAQTGIAVAVVGFVLVLVGFLIK
jgi:hypothetical protein